MGGLRPTWYIVLTAIAGVYIIAYALTAVIKAGMRRDTKKEQIDQ